MKILMVHTRYLERGGEDETTDIETAMLRQRGHDVVLYEETNERIAQLGLIRTASRTIWSAETRRRMGVVLSDPFDVVHVQNFFPLISPVAHRVASHHDVPVVQSLHNYRLICPAATLFRDGAPCEDCLGRRFSWPGILHACYRDSRPGTAAIAAMAAAHRLLGTWSNDVDVYVAPSQFARDKYLEGGFSGVRIEVKPHTVYPDPGPGRGEGGFALFVGRLSREKGIEMLLEAWSAPGVTMPIRIVGDGPLEPLVRASATSNPLVDYLGRKSLEDVYALMGAAAVVVVPSTVYETFGRVALEAYASATPVVVSRIGALTELVDDGGTGFLFEPGATGDLAAIMTRLSAEPRVLRAMRAKARAKFAHDFTATANIEQLERIYEDAIDARLSGSR